MPQNTILGIAGDVRAAELIPKLKKWLEGWQRSEVKEELAPNPVPSTTRKLYLVDRPGSVQATIWLGNIAIDRRDPDYIPMVLMNRLLGSGPSGRLFTKLREEKGYTYSASSSFVPTKYPGPWLVFADVRTAVTDAALAELLSEIRRMGEERVPDLELEEQKRAVSAGFALSLEQPAQMLSYAVNRRMYGFSADYWDTYPARIMGVSAEDVQRVARKYLDTDAVQIVVVGEASQIKGALAKYGPIELYNTEGNLTSVTAAPSKATSRR